MYELVGTRAQGMAGAFVAVADDATATWWNPAGVATGAYFSLLFERATLSEPATPLASEPAWTGRASALAVSFPALALSYYRVRISEAVLAGSTEGGDPGRQQEGAAGLGVRALAVSQYGATVGQSLGGHVIFASTLKLVRAGTVGSFETGPGDPLDRAADLDVDIETRSDLDVGVMASLGTVRLGLSVRNLREPEFGEGAERLRLARQARGGVAWVSGPRGPLNALTAALDVDLTTTSTAVGDVKHVAAGLEAWMLARHLGVRAGVSSNRIGAEGSSASVGVSLGLGSGLFLDGALTTGSDRSRQGWALGGRVAF
jgi:hypothetical protein